MRLFTRHVGSVHRRRRRCLCIPMAYVNMYICVRMHYGTEYWWWCLWWRWWHCFVVVMVVTGGGVRSHCILHQMHHACVERRTYSLGPAWKTWIRDVKDVRIPWVWHERRILNLRKSNYLKLIFFLYVKLRLSSTTQEIRTSFNGCIYVFQAKPTEYACLSWSA